MEKIDIAADTIALMKGKWHTTGYATAFRFTQREYCWKKRRGEWYSWFPDIGKLKGGPDTVRRDLVGAFKKV